VDAYTQYLVNELGYAVIAPNVRGSSGSGRTFLGLDNGELREDSVRDIGSLLVWIGLQPDLDRNRVVVLGAPMVATAPSPLIHYGDRLAGAGCRASATLHVPDHTGPTPLKPRGIR
jgi:hypothetical protein